MQHFHRKLFRLAFCGLSVLSISTGQSAAAEPFVVEPGVGAKPPAVIFSSPAPGDLVTTFSVLTLETSGVLTTRRDDQVTSLQIDMPEMREDTYVEVAVTTSGASSVEPFAWRTLARPDGKPLMQYEGRREMLPPPDFDEYWARAKKQLAAVPMQPNVTRIPDKDTSTGLLFRVELPSVEQTTIVCWYYVPREAFTGGDPQQKVARKFPAVQIAPGYGAEEPPIDRTKQGFITLSVNPRNHGPSRAFWKSPVEHLIYNVTDPESYYYKLAFLDCLRAAEFLFSREEVDVKRVATEGGSQGGLFSIATAALEPRIACVCANVPAFSDYPDGVILAQKGGQTTMHDLLTDGATTAAQVRTTLSYVDGVNMITRLKCPVQINMGDQDPVCPYVCGIVLYNRLPKRVPKDFHVAPNCKHAVPQIMRDWNSEWFKRWLK
jgi:cephalosporin-C deacetylase-like acetyl esterase